MPIAHVRIMNRRLVMSTVLGLCLGIGAMAPTALGAPPGNLLAQRSGDTGSTRGTGPASTTAHPVASAADASRYAAAERARPEAARFEGGATFVIVGSTTALLLGIILLVVLL
jgi:hypothetical protein